MREILQSITLLDERAVAAQLNCKVKTLQAWRVRGGALPWIRVGRLVRYDPRDVEEFLRSRRVNSTSEQAR